ncbi:unnamed protein product, partial [Rhizoctonia solani]
MRPYLADDQFPSLKNDLLLRAATGKYETSNQTYIRITTYYQEKNPLNVLRYGSCDRPDGTYLFREVRKSHGFFEICRTPDLATEITLQPIRRYSGLLDASIIFSDILVIPQAMGLVVEMHDGGGPFFPQPLVAPDDLDLKRLHENVDVDQELGYVFDAITMTRKGLNGEVPLIGFCGAPWTLMCYMVGSSKSLPSTKQWIFKYPEESKRLLEKITKVCVEFLVGQVKSGAQLLQVFDSNAGDLSPHDFATFSLPYIKDIAESVRHKLANHDPPIPIPPMTLFAKGAGHALSDLTKAGYNVLGLDWVTSPEFAIAATGGPSRTVGLQGNIDPAILYGGREAIEREVKLPADPPRPNSALGGSLINNIRNMTLDCSASFIAYSLLSTFSTIAEDERDAVQVILELIPCYDILSRELHVTHEAHVVARMFLDEFRTMASRHSYIQEGDLEDVAEAQDLLNVIILPLVHHLSEREYNEIRRTMEDADKLLSNPLDLLNDLLNMWRLRNCEVVSEWHSHPIDGFENYYFGMELPDGARLAELLMPLPYPTRLHSIDSGYSTEDEGPRQKHERRRKRQVRSHASESGKPRAVPRSEGSRELALKSKSKPQSRHFFLPRFTSSRTSSDSAHDSGDNSDSSRSHGVHSRRSPNFVERQCLCETGRVCIMHPDRNASNSEPDVKLPRRKKLVDLVKTAV